ncbi:MAG: alanine--tRNA ligase [Acidimicrobiia bacterium]|nr:alanine--tRNA ligase [Acidimicrobiia bacterium]
MNTQEIRNIFHQFFAERDHTIVPSASLIPIDPTLMLTVAGMVPFKPYFLGEEKPPYPRAVSVQKCGRTEDIDLVGTTARHLTFFEMLGNFSFGDYFKAEAIPWAYELVTEGFGVDPDRLWFTVHHSDDEAAAIWIDEVGINPARLQRRDRDNFWQMGIPGPCGPSSEIFFDRGPAYGPEGGPAVDEERFMEIWNLVFMQNVQDEPYHVVGDLPAKNIDTGAGLERVAMALQGVDTVFETDELRSIIAAAERATGARFEADERGDISLRILGDHGRAVTVLIADKVVPSNQGRGYVLRRVLRRAVRHAVLLGSTENIMPTMVEATIAAMSEAYPELIDRKDAILEMADREEGRFRRTLESGQRMLDDALEDLTPDAVLEGDVAFKLHDTHGFPLELTEEIVSERGYSVDVAEFDRLMEAQKEMARASFKSGLSADVSDEYRALIRGLDGTSFIGYDAEAGTARVLAMVSDGEPVDRVAEGQPVELFLDRTPFYAESGGQIGDTGVIQTETGILEVGDTQLAVQGVHGHRGVVTSGYLQVGQDAETSIASVRRERIRKNHTGTHLLHWALRDVLGDHVHQEGSLVADNRLRFDFSHFKAVEADELVGIERAVNERIVENATVNTIETSKADAEKMGALAFFGDKYGEQVRVVQTGSYSTEFCGGTHVPTTGQVGPLVLVSEGSVAANTRRVEALTGVAGYEHLLGIRNQLRETASLLRAQDSGVVDAVRGLTVRLKDQEERIAEFEAKARQETAGAVLDGAENHSGHTLVVLHEEGATPDQLRALAFQLRDQIKTGIGVLGSNAGGKAALLAFVTADLVAEGVSAGEITGAAARVVGGGGSRDPELAQAGGPNGDEIEAALEVARDTARSALQGV